MAPKMCRNCGAPLDPYATQEIRWSPGEGKYGVRATYICGLCGDHSHTPDSVDQQYRVEVPKVSACGVCGGKLRLGEYRLSYDSNRIVWEGEYVCDSCHKKSKALYKRVASRLSRGVANLKVLRIPVAKLEWDTEKPKQP